MKKSTLVKVYNWQALVRLAIQDMQEQNGLPSNIGDIHYIGGVDSKNNPFIRIDLTPLGNSAKFRP